jgi:glycylpeptide N-tetradecanoyltransferase
VLRFKDPESHRITDFFSFYSLPSTVINNTKYPILEAAYLYYYGTETAFASQDEEKLLRKRLMSLIGDALIVATAANFDVFNALTLMDNVPILKDLKVNFQWSFIIL